MAAFCLAGNLDNLETMLGNMVVAYTRDKKPITAGDLKAAGAMTVLLKDALRPNLVQTLEGNPAFVHGGPFANIAHGCNSVIATRSALKLADYVVTEAGFGADLGAEKFFDIKCRKASLKPSGAVIVATIRALKSHGGVARDALHKEDLAALKKGMVNLERHVANVGKFGVPAVVAINHFSTDTDAENAVVVDACRDQLGVDAIVCRHWADGSRGAEDLARRVVALVEAPEERERGHFQFLYQDAMPLWEKVRTIATEIYGASDITADQLIRNQFNELQSQGHGQLPICIRKHNIPFLAIQIFAARQVGTSSQFAKFAYRQGRVSLS